MTIRINIIGQFKDNILKFHENIIVISLSYSFQVKNKALKIYRSLVGCKPTCHSGRNTTLDYRSGS